MHVNEEFDETEEPDGLPAFDLDGMLPTASAEQPVQEEDRGGASQLPPAAAAAEPAQNKHKPVAGRYCHEVGHRADNKEFGACYARLQADKAKEKAAKAKQAQADEAAVEE